MIDFEKCYFCNKKFLIDQDTINYNIIGCEEEDCGLIGFRFSKNNFEFKNLIGINIIFDKSLNNFSLSKNNNKWIMYPYNFHVKITKLTTIENIIKIHKDCLLFS